MYIAPDGTITCQCGHWIWQRNTQKWIDRFGNDFADGQRKCMCEESLPANPEEDNSEQNNSGG